MKLREQLEAIQSIEHHKLIGTTVLHQGKKVKLTLASVCRKCPNKKECKQVSLALAAKETELLNNGTNYYVKV